MDNEIKGAINYYDQNFEEQISKLDKSKSVFVKEGGRSGNALESMRKLDFQELYDLDVGSKDWKMKSHATIRIKVSFFLKKNIFFI